MNFTHVPLLICHSLRIWAGLYKLSAYKPGIAYPVIGKYWGRFQKNVYIYQISTELQLSNIGYGITDAAETFFAILENENEKNEKSLW